ncbi:MAG: hypothetical protein WC935_00335 [Thermoleophilia bacterium]
MYRWTATCVGQDGGELKPPGKGWLFVSCALDPDSDKLIVVWKKGPLEVNWLRTTASIPEFSRAGEEPV